jgi:hypothetical protein
MKQRMYILLLLTTLTVVAYAQQPKTTLFNLPEKAIASLTKKYQNLDKQITQQTQKYIASLEKQEQTLQKQLHTKDSVKAKLQLASMQLHYKKLRDKLSKANTQLQPTNEYLPQLDSITTAAQFLQDSFKQNITNNITTKNNPKLQTPNIALETRNELNALTLSLNKVQSKLQASADIKRMMKERKDQLRKQLGDLGVTKQLDNISKQTYYYKQQLTEYKTILKDKDKAQQKILGLLKENNSFKDFMKKNGFLGKLFPEQSGGAAAANPFPVGLQTREQILNELQQKFGSADAFTKNGIGGSGNFLQDQLTKAKNEFSKIKADVNKAGNNVSDADMPHFKPNTQKGKSLLKRLEIGMNVQSVKSSSFLPTTTDLALTLGYKLNDKSTIGVGAAYKLGWGSGWKDIKLTSQGVGIRSFLDIHLLPNATTNWQKMVSNIWISGGYELNYLPDIKEKEGTTPLFGGVGGGWQEAALLGLSKKYSKGKKKAQVQLLYNFLYKQTYPQQQPLLFRVGWGL